MTSRFLSKLFATGATSLAVAAGSATPRVTTHVYRPDRRARRHLATTNSANAITAITGWVAAPI